MKQIVLAIAAALGVTALATPAQAARFKWSVDYTGFFADDAFISGFFIAEDTDAADGIVSGDEFDSWEWTWSGNSDVEAFTISSSDGDFAFDSAFYVDGTPNQVDFADGLDQGFYFSDEFGLDLEFLFVDNFADGTSTSGTTAGSIFVSEPVPVPEPATLLGLLTLAGTVAMAKRQQQAT